MTNDTIQQQRLQHHNHLLKCIKPSPLAFCRIKPLDRPVQGTQHDLAERHNLYIWTDFTGLPCHIEAFIPDPRIIVTNRPVPGAYFFR